jgi:hypothetical protein
MLIGVALRPPALQAAMNALAEAKRVNFRLPDEVINSSD